jgi:N-formylglutamate amidohydrolase
VSFENFSISNRQTSSPIVLHVPHSARTIPDSVKSALLIPEPILEEELNEVTDTLTDQIALGAVKSLPESIPKPRIFQNNLSRFVIDPERFPDDREVMNKVGMGAVYKKTTSGRDLRPSDFQDAELLERYFHPYAQAFTDLVDEVLENVGRVVIIDVHSYRSKQHQNAVNHGQRRPAMCIGTDIFHTPRWLAELFEKEFGQLGDYFENEPYAGTYVPLRHYNKEPRVSSIMMETRADTFLDANLMPHDGMKRVTSALAAILIKISEMEGAQ